MIATAYKMRNRILKVENEQNNGEYYSSFEQMSVGFCFVYTELQHQVHEIEVDSTNGTKCEDTTQFNHNFSVYLIARTSDS